MHREKSNRSVHFKCTLCCFYGLFLFKPSGPVYLEFMFYCIFTHELDNKRLLRKKHRFWTHITKFIAEWSFMMLENRYLPGLRMRTRDCQQNLISLSMLARLPIAGYVQILNYQPLEPIFSARSKCFL